ncbi:MAG TPA: cytochrome c biogenesis protein CcsA [Pirellulales bacterium]|nr:cytochrome c biogenesis protein CcsA [Pirellulales bacterium]
MASDILQQRHAADLDRETDAPQLAGTIAYLLRPLASLKLTVLLMALAIFLILAGTLAQIDKGIWDVMADYFRTPLAWINLRVFFPRSWSIPDFSFPFPGGFTIGGAMLVNLLAAHTLRFKIQARGARLLAGLAVIAAGAGMTWLVVASGSSAGGLQDAPLIEWSTLWTILKASLALLWLATLFALIKIDSARQYERVGLAIVAAGLGALIAWLYMRSEFELGASSLRILWQLLKGGLASLILLAGCMLLFRKRAGIVLLHGGIALMMINELVVYGLHSEALMQIKEGETVNYAQDLRTVELAIIDPSNPDEDDVVVVPQSYLTEGSVVRDKQLPFDFEVVRFLPNSNLREWKQGEENPADTGTGKQFVADAARAGTGADNNSKVDMSAAYVRVLDRAHDDKPLGTYLVGILQSFKGVAEKVTVDGKTYDMALRFKRDYKPYSMHLIDGRADKYMGTNTPSNYSSDLRLVDTSRHVDRKVHIWMNNPLRYGGETFYQSQMEVDPATGREFTGLSVVANAGWMIPYVACMIVATGLLAHFSIVLLRFLRRRTTADADGVLVAKNGRRVKVTAPTSTTADWAIPLAVIGAALLFMFSVVRPPRVPDGEPNLAAFGQLPVMYQGRLKPFDTLARNSLRIISDSETYVDENDKRQPAVKWLLDVIVDPSEAARQKVVRIQNLEVLDMLGLSRRQGFRYSINEFREHMAEFEKQATAARAVDPAEQSVFQKKILELDSRLALYSTLLRAFDQPQIRRDHAAEDLLEAMRQQQRVFSQLQAPLVIPPASGSGDWEPYTVAWTKAFAQANLMNQEPNPATLDFNEIVVGYAKKDAAAFNKAVTGYESALAARPPAGLNVRKIDFEASFNHARLFFWASWMYVVAFVLAAIGWLGWSRPMNRAALGLVLVTFVIHTIALVSRIYISGRPPVTNLYSAAIFIGWGGVLLGIILEAVYRLGIGNIIAGAVGFSTLVIADKLAGDGDTFTVLQAVLDTQFWLATHVTCITTGYTTTFVAGALGILYIVGGVLTPSLTKRRADELARMIYGCVCFAIFFSFVGTVLGGLWADDSWGRFWGWDPKENGALIIVLWNALVLHARWDGMIRDRGLATLAVVGNIAVAWSMFGVNQLSVGLHSYGFTEGIALALIVFVASQLGIVALALVPRAKWWSSRAAAA